MNPGGVFPVALELDTLGPGGDNLASKNINDSFQFGWHENAKWTGWGSMGHNASDVASLIADYGVGNINETVTAKDTTNPGTMLDTTNGVQAGNVQSVAGFVGKTLVFPVIVAGSNETISFIALKITSVTVQGSNSVVTGTLVAGPASGTGNHTPNAGANNPWISRNEPVRVRLVQ